MAKLLNKNQLSKKLGISLPTIASWLKKGLPVTEKGRRGIGWKFNLNEVRAWLENRNGTDPELTRARINLIKIRASILELEEKKLRGEVHDVQQCENLCFQITRTIRDRLLTIPSRVSGILATETDQYKVFDILRNEIRETLIILRRNSNEARG